MPIPLLAIAGAGAFASGLATLAGGFQSAKANKAKALGAQIEASMARLRGTQIAERSREDLATAQGNIATVRAGRNVGDSATGRMIERRTMQDAYRDEGVARLGEINRAANADMEAKGYKSAARWSIPMAVLQSAGSFASAASYGSAAMAKPKGKP